MDVYVIFYKISVWVFPIIISVTLHEIAHGWIAWKLGDDTAFLHGRITLNPIKHLDLFGTLFLPAFLLLFSGGKLCFGYAKPVPVNFFALSKPRRDTVLVALAGPASNLILAIIAALLLNLVQLAPIFLQSWIIDNLMILIFFNLILCIFNMIPILPLDGGRAVIGILPPVIAQRFERLERVGFSIILCALFLLPWVGDQLGFDLNIFMWVIVIPATELASFLINVIGVM